MNKLNKKIHCFGDSWTHGVGSELPPGSGIMNLHDRYHTDTFKSVVKLYSWPGRLRKKTNIDVENYGFPGATNKQIYQEVLKNIRAGIIKKHDLVIVMWSSIIREPLNFFTMPDNDNIGFIHYCDSSEIKINRHHGFEIPHWIHNLTNDMEDQFNKSTYVVYKDFLLNRLNYDFLYEISMNYICNLQVYFSEMGIDYLFVNAFEPVISTNSSLYKFINLKKWLLPTSTMRHLLLSKINLIDENLPYSYWEDDFKVTDIESFDRHPNRLGYSLIADEIYNFMINNKYEI